MVIKITKRLFMLLLLHGTIMLLILAGLITLFFQFGLPAITRHNHLITVPNLKGIGIAEVKDVIAYKKLRYQVREEEMYLPNYPPGVVLEQYPKAGSKVKENRNIYVTLNTNTPPKVLMPNLVDGSIRNAYIMLKSRGLTCGRIVFVKDIAKNAVLEQSYQGKVIAPGTSISQGSAIDLTVGAGLEDQSPITPDLINMPLEEAELLLLDNGMRIGKVVYEYMENWSVNVVFQQYPKVGSVVELGEPISLWVTEADKILPQRNNNDEIAHLPIMENLASPKDTTEILIVNGMD